MVELPKFLRAVGSDDPTPLPPLLTPREESPVAKANELGNTLASLIAKDGEQREEINFLRRHNEALADQLNRCERERDYYINRSRYFESFCLTITANFHTVRMIMDRVQDAAHNAGLNPPRQDEPQEAGPTPTEVKTAELERLLHETRRDDSETSRNPV